MVKHTQTIRWLLPTNCLSVFDHFVELALKGLKNYSDFHFTPSDFFTLQDLNNADIFDIHSRKDQNLLGTNF